MIAIVGTQHSCAAGDGDAGVAEGEPARVEGLLAVAGEEQGVGSVAGQGPAQAQTEQGEVLDLVDEHC
jgi:hypothetical protein